MSSIDRSGWKATINWGLVTVVAVGFLLRLIACWQTESIVQDGPLYLFQAQSVAALRFGQALGCLGYLSSYPFLVALAFPLTGDWINAGQLVSLICGTATIVPLYFLVARITNQRAGLVTATIFTVLPAMVGISADVLRDAPFWFFAATGLFLFVRSIDEDKALLPVVSCLFLLLAIWTRIEGIVFLGVSVGFVLLGGVGRRSRKTGGMFLFPLFATGLLLAVVLPISGIAPGRLLRFQELFDKAGYGLAAYSALRADLAGLISQHPASTLGFFLEEVRRSVWITGLAVLLNRLLETLSYLYALFLFAGLSRTVTAARDDRRIVYLLLCAAGLLVMFYYQVFCNWMLYYRMMVTLLLPASIILGFGAARILARIQGEAGTGTPLSLLVLLCGLILFSLPKNLAARNTGELPFRLVGETIAAAKQKKEPAKIWSSPVSHRVVSCYANRYAADPPCPEGFVDRRAVELGADPQALSRYLKEEGFRYFVWEESFWRQHGSLTPAILSGSGIFTPLGEWDSTPFGRIVAYELR
ncbi:MAG: glycosyltransferase family 39 protein [Thermodesulfobacteriota bacterium]